MKKAEQKSRELVLWFKNIQTLAMNRHVMVPVLMGLC